MDTGTRINRISNRLRRRSKRAQERLGITASQGNILDYILVESENHSVYQKDIEQEFGLRPSTATEVLNYLEGRNLICRVKDEKDGRYKKLVFTEEADRIRKILRKEIEHSEEILLEGISQEDQEQFKKITSKMLENLEREERQDG